MKLCRFRIWDPFPALPPKSVTKRIGIHLGICLGHLFFWGGPSLTRLWTIHQVSKEAFQPGTWPTGFGEVFCEGMCQLTTFWRNVILQENVFPMGPLGFWSRKFLRSAKTKGLIRFADGKLPSYSYEISESRHEAIKISCFMSCQGFVAQFELPEKSTERQLLHPSRRKKMKITCWSNKFDRLNFFHCSIRKGNHNLKWLWLRTISHHESMGKNTYMNSWFFWYSQLIGALPKTNSSLPLKMGHIPKGIWSSPNHQGW